MTITHRMMMRVAMVATVLVTIYSFLYMPAVVNYILKPKRLNILAWPNEMNSEFFKDFEQKTGVTVYLSFFDSVEEMAVKMSTGGHDYDLIMVSDYATKTLIENNLVKPIDKKRLTFWQDLYPSLLGIYCDPNNEYTIPYSWDVFGIGIDTSFFKDGPPEASWDLLFDTSKSPGLVGMIDDAREVTSIAALYLFGTSKHLSADQLNQIESLLVTQKAWVSMYTNWRIDFLLLSQTTPVAMALSSHIKRAMKESEHIEFLVPKEGSFLVVDSFLISAQSQNEDHIYEFLNYLYQPDILQKYINRFNFLSTSQKVQSDDDHSLMRPTKKLLSQVQFFRHKLPETRMRELWISLKS